MSFTKKAIIPLGLVAIALIAQTTQHGGFIIKGLLDATGATATRPVKTGTGAAAGTCTTGDLYFRSGTGTPSANFYVCDPANTQNVVGPSGGSPNAQYGLFSALPTCDSGNNHLLYLFTDSAYNTGLCDNPNWQYFRDGLTMTPPLSSGWTWDNQGSCMIDSTNGYEFESCPATGSTTNSARIRYRTAPAAPYTVTAHLLHDTSDSDGGYSAYGLFFRDGTGKVISFMLQSTPPATIAGTNPQPVSGGFQVNAGAEWTNSTTYTGTHLTSWPTTGVSGGFGTATTALLRTPACIQISDNNTNLIYRVSADCVHWKQVKSASRTQFFGSGPTQIGFGANPINNATDVALISWLVN